MNDIQEILSQNWANALGWTLLHSLWQCALVFLVTSAALRLIPAALSRTRYAVACGGLALVFLSSAVTLAYVIDTQYQRSGVQAVIHVPGESSKYSYSQNSPDRSLTARLTSITDNYMPYVLGIWIAGFVFFATRLASGLWYTGKLRAEALPFQNKWSDYIKVVSGQLGISRLVSLAESRSITGPMVIGYLKPVILIPAGMLTGLSTEQLETVFVHELAHIKRHDYIINFIQSFLETVFFFNPFVWIMSNIIRKEREYCCDDMVIHYHGGTRAYAYALTHLAELRLTKQAFALSLATNKNHLLNRIRRIMEKSAKNHSNKTRILLPAILLTASLLCISWLGVQQEKPRVHSALEHPDTIIDDQKKGAVYSRKSIITIDENGQPHEEVAEQFEGDEELRPLLENQIPPIPDISKFSPALPPNAVVPRAFPHLSIPGIPDSLPVLPFGNLEWEGMAKAFEEHFRDFEMRSMDAEKFMKEFEDKFKWEDWTTKFDSLKVHEDVLQRLRDFDSFPELEEQLERLRAFEMEDFKKMELDFKNHEKSFRSYEHELRDELVKDGYLSESETIESLQWDDTLFKVNGKKIKESDLKKYQKLHDKYFNTPDISGKVE